jgi:hypothetical protein
MSLRVTGMIPTPGDGLPDVYRLENPTTGAATALVLEYPTGERYEFTSRNGWKRTA